MRTFEFRLRSTNFIFLALACSFPATICAQAQLDSTQAISVQNAEKALGSEIDDATPEAAIRSFYGALAKGDAKSARKLLVSPEKMTEWTEIQAKLSVSFKRFGAAAVEKFGEDGKVLQVPVPAETVLKKLATIKPVEEGDTAQWRVNPKAPMKMQRVDGNWKLDLHASFNDPEQLKEFNQVYDQIATYITEVADQIDKGKLETVTDVQEELKRQRKAMNEQVK